MFFIGIMGIGNKEKVITELPGITCKACESYGRYTVLKRYNYFHIFFLPVWKWGNQYYVLERECNTVFGLKEEAGLELEKGSRKEIFSDELIELYDTRKCKQCGQVLENNYIYCPHCGVEQ